MNGWHPFQYRCDVSGSAARGKLNEVSSAPCRAAALFHIDKPAAPAPRSTSDAAQDEEGNTDPRVRARHCFDDVATFSLIFYVHINRPC